MLIDESVISAVATHMNDDHPDDSLLIARAFGFPEATAAEMSTLDAQGGTWRVVDPGGEHELTVPWPTGAIAERPQIRRAVVMLYREACTRLGVPAREEHAPAAHSDAAAHPHGAAHPHAAAHPGGAHHAAPVDDGGFAYRIRTATWGDHGDSEGATFMADLMRGKGTRDDYIDLVAQHFFMYEALEHAALQLLADAELAELHPAALRRMDAVIRDLEHLLGEQWRERISPVPATAAYARRITDVADQGWIAGIVAHHYTRYLGDLSGGQAIARRMAKQFDLDGDGVAFYDFSALGDLTEFKVGYRAGLDAFGLRLSDVEQQRMLDEVRAAYHFNTDVFVGLGERRGAA